MTKHGFTGSIALPIAFVLAMSGCATKKFVQQKVDPVSAQVTQLQNQQTQTGEKLDALSTKHDRDISQVNERVSTLDTKLTQTASTADGAQTAANNAMQASQANSARIDSTDASVRTLTAGMANALNYQLVDKADVTFGFNKDELTDDAKAVLDQIATKINALPRSMVEVAGFTDQIGSKDYNLGLSNRRADAVARYLVTHNVPLYRINQIGLGEETPPQGLEADLSTIDPNPTKAQLDQLARRVRVRIFGAGDITQGTAARAQQ